MSDQKLEIVIRNTREEDFSQIIKLTQEVYPKGSPWKINQLISHLKIFPEGQFVAVERPSNRIVGMAASLIVVWDDYNMETNWYDFTGHGFFTNHDPVRGRTLYGAEVMVHPSLQGTGIGKKLYQARQALAKRLKLLRIRAGARLRGYHRYKDVMSPETYVDKVIHKELKDPTLSFQLNLEFHVIAVVQHYLQSDPESLGYAAVIEWINDEMILSEKEQPLRKFLT
jgi:GNAT superfamily N-acetyltransferase